MRTVLWGEFREFVRNPGMFLMMVGLTLAFAVAIGFFSQQSLLVPVYGDIEESEAQVLIERLNENDAYDFQWESEDSALQKVRSGHADLALELLENDYRFKIAAHTESTVVVNQYVAQIFEEEQTIQLAQQLSGEEPSNFRERVDRFLEETVFDVHVSSFRTDETFLYDQTAQAVFGFTLFFLTFSIGYSVHNVLVRKEQGIWDRLLISPLSKLQMYAGFLCFSFLLGYAQVILLFSVFHFIFGMEFGGALWKVILMMIPYLFAIIAMSMLVVSLVKSSRHFDVIMPIIAVSMAMLGGAYWPLEIVTMDALLIASKVLPLTYGMEVLNGFVVYGYSWNELLYPIAILTLMGVVFMAVGINAMERRTK